MASFMIEIAAFLVIFVCIIQGTQDPLIEHEELVNATVGQNITLPCMISEMQEIFMTQMEWRKEGESVDQKLAVFNPNFPTSVLNISLNVKLQPVNITGKNITRGSILHLLGVTEKYSGNYVCDITTFPTGSIKRSTKVQVTEPEISVKVIAPGGSLIEGDEVNITCFTHPPVNGYKLISLKSNLSLDSQNGQFTIVNVTRHTSDLICHPLWNSSNQHLQSLRASLPLTVDFLDSIECNASSQIKVEAGTNVTITCEAKSSRSINYTWLKGNVTVSQNATLSLWSVNPEHSGMYSVIIHSGNHSRLWKQRDFVLTVFIQTHPVPNTEYQSSTTFMETTSQFTDGTESTTVLTSRSDHVNKSACSTSAHTDVYNNTITPSAGYVTTSHENITTTLAIENSSSVEQSTLPSNQDNISSSPGSTKGGSSIPNASTTLLMPRSTSKFPLTTGKILTNETKNVEVQRCCKAYAFLLPTLLLLLLICFLYRRYIIQKRMDLPPPFKPPPPPVKYTSVRNQDIPMTDILVR